MAICSTNFKTCPSLTYQILDIIMHVLKDACSLDAVMKLTALLKTQRHHFADKGFPVVMCRVTAGP